MATLDDFKPYIRPEVPGVDEISLENHIRMVINEFCDKTWVIQKGITHDVDPSDIDHEMNGSVTVGLSGYARNLRPVWLVQLLVDGEEWNVHYIDLVNDTPDLDIIRGGRRKVFHFPGQTSVRVAPLDRACRLFLRLAFKPSPAATTFDDVLLHDWVKGIAAGVKSELMFIPERPWSNARMAEYYAVQFRREISEAKARVSKDYSMKSKSVRPVEFGVWD